MLGFRPLATTPLGATRLAAASGATRAWLPSDLGSKCWAWYDPTDTTNVALSGSSVTSWAPSYGVGPTLTPNVNGTPVVDASTFGGIRSISLGNSRSMGATGISFSGSTSYSVFQVLKAGASPFPASGGNVGRFFSIADIASGSPDWNSNASTSWGPKKSDGFAEWYRNGEVFITGTKDIITTGATLLLDCVQDGTNGYMYQDGALIGTDTSTSTFASTAMCFADMAQNFPSTVGDRCGDTFYGDQVITKGVLTSDEIARIQGYNAWKWGLQADLPSGHAYKSAPPTIADNNVTLAPASGAITVAGQTSTVTAGAGNTLAPASGSVTVSGQTSTVTSPRLVAPASGAITLTGQTPTVTSTANNTLAPAAGVITLTRQTSTVTGAVANASFGVADGSVSDSLVPAGVSYPNGTIRRVA